MKSEDISDIRKFEDLPKAVQDYVIAIEKMFGTKVGSI
ncbi:MAG: hypothetical protein HOE19_02970 [Candidatus Komeilibacteria bacterium]|nr:hypothetical protein [Candidatus Komeilibacteria bacterium]MBT4447638.1 hypothetical protein [Candidatus Komeilibacteria bacterium]